ncbi:MAG: glutathione S-transferase [Sandaracinaceae bacterium]|nr:glutathione S-transferase [Sandaracinaceae bacterium]
MTTKATLLGLSYSPWTIRARWALKHHAVPHRYREHVIFLGEPALRWRARRLPGGRATVPLFTDGPLALGESYAIIEHADRVGSGASLRADEPSVRAWAERVEPALQEARVRVTRQILSDPEALTEAAASATPRFAAPLFRPLAAMGARHVAKKYEFGVNGETASARTEAALDALRAAIGDGEYVEGGFSAADLIAASFLQGVRPIDGYIRLDPATRRAWTDDALADRYADLLAWRDALFAKHWPAQAS